MNHIFLKIWYSKRKLIVNEWINKKQIKYVYFHNSLKEQSQRFLVNNTRNDYGSQKKKNYLLSIIEKNVKCVFIDSTWLAQSVVRWRPNIGKKEVVLSSRERSHLHMSNKYWTYSIRHIFILECAPNGFLFTSNYIPLKVHQYFFKFYWRKMSHIHDHNYPVSILLLITT